MAVWLKKVGHEVFTGDFSLMIPVQSDNFIAIGSAPIPRAVQSNQSGALIVVWAGWMAKEVNPKRRVVGGKTKAW